MSAKHSLNGLAFLPDIDNATQSNQVYYNSATGELTYGAAAGGATPTLDEVTTAGNTTSNSVNTGVLTTSVTAANHLSIETSLKVKVNRASVGNGSTNRLLFQDCVRGPSSSSILGDVGSLDFFRLVSASNTRGRFDVNIKQESPGDTQVRTFSVNYDGTAYLNVNGGNTLVGTTTDAGYKLDVNGNTAVRGSVYVPDTSGTLRAAIGPYDSNEIAFYGTRWKAGSGNLYYTGQELQGSSSFGLRGNTGIYITVANPNSGGGVSVYTAAPTVVYNNYGRTVLAVGRNGAPPAGSSSHTVNAIVANPTFDMTNVSGTNSLRGFVFAPTITNSTVGGTEEIIAIRTDVGKVIHTGLTNATHSDQVYYDSATGELTYGAASGGSTPTLDEVTTAGSSTTNNISVGTMTSSKTEVDFTPTSDTIALDIRGTGTPNDYFTLSNATGGANDVFLPIFFYKAATYGYNGGTNRYTSGVYGGGFIAAVDDASYPSAAGAGAAMHFNSRAYANNGPLSNRYLFSWGSWLTTHMAITAGGNLLIGTTTDSGYKLSVNGNTSVSGDINADGDFYQNGTQGYTGTVTIQQPSPLPPINIDIQGGIITNVT